jgi:hypothetical protein
LCVCVCVCVCVKSPNPQFWDEVKNLFSSYTHAVFFYFFTLASVINKPGDTRDWFNTDKEEKTRHDVHLTKPVRQKWTSLSFGKFHFSLQKIKC